ncbi:MAG: hypothetical protein F4073_04290 [Rhodobacteraceae bacterium]|nr:hypothetical protein [Paracoccaceae bacterium]MYF47011.1 hypothetical protein [Paracoccaceae bacterium]MYI91156.1 hypothetical protein [Paracoccaceae bacterium]
MSTKYPLLFFLPLVFLADTSLVAQEEVPLVPDSSILNFEIPSEGEFQFEIESEPILGINIDAVGLIPSGISGFPNNLWGSSRLEVIQSKISNIQNSLVPAALELFYVLLLAEANPTWDSSGEGELFLTRVDKLIELGALEHANELMDRSGGKGKELDIRRFDIALLTNTEHIPCSGIRNRTIEIPSYTHQIYCFVRLGEWKNAELLFEAAKTIGDFTSQEEQIVTIFLFPELALSIANQEFVQLTPLLFRMLKDSGFYFYHKDIEPSLAFHLKDSSPEWKSRIESLEKLVRSNSQPFESLLVAYTESKPSSTDGVWARVRLIQALENAIAEQDSIEIKELFLNGYFLMEREGLSVKYTEYFVPRIIPHIVEFGRIAPGHYSPAILFPFPPEDLEIMSPSTREENFLFSLRSGNLENATPSTPLQQGIISGLTETDLEDDLIVMANQGKFGEAVLDILAILQDVNQTSPNEIRRALVGLTALGLEQMAREISIQILVIENEKLNR